MTTGPPPVGLRRAGLDPDPTVTALRDGDATCPASTHLGYAATLVAGYADARAVHADPAFAFGPLGPPPGMPDELPLRRGFLLAMDPPDHARLRTMLTSRFTHRAVRALEPQIAAIVDRALDEMIAGGPPADLMADFALPVPSLVICELLGVPYADRAGFQDRATRLLVPQAPADRMVVEQEAHAFMTDLVARARQAPGDDLLGLLVREFGERPAAAGWYGQVRAAELLPLLLGHANRAAFLGHRITRRPVPALADAPEPMPLGVDPAT